MRGLFLAPNMHFYLAYVHDESKHLEWYCSTCVPCAKLPSRSAVELQWYRALCHLVHCGNSFSPSSVYTIFLLTSVVRMFWRSEEHTSELQSRPHLVCRLLLEKKKNSISLQGCILVSYLYL